MAFGRSFSSVPFSRFPTAFHLVFELELLRADILIGNIVCRSNKHISHARMCCEGIHVHWNGKASDRRAYACFSSILLWVCNK